VGALVNRRVCTNPKNMKKITLRADEQLIRRAKLVARTQGKSLNAAFREWLAQFVEPAGHVKEVEALMMRLRHIKADRRFSREEMMKDRTCLER
jgi:plasmid stability protein